MRVVTPSVIRQLFALLCEDPSKGSRKLGKELDIGHSTVDKYRNLARNKSLSSVDVRAMTDEQIIEIFGLNNKVSIFIVPEWDEIVRYLLSPRKWGCKMNTEHNAWLFYYVKKHWPMHLVNEPLPPDCMSERTFNRRYKEHIDSLGLGFIKHQPNANMQFGPGSMIEIDTIGDKFTYYDTTNECKKNAILFTAVCKFSGYIYAEPMPGADGHCWAQAIINALWFFGGLFECCRMDNDSAICLHGKKYGSVKYSRLRPTVHCLFRDLHIQTDLCPKQSPEWKGSCENSNFQLERELFADATKYKLPLHVSSLDELKRLIGCEVERINLKPRSNSNLSRKALFDQYEKHALQPLPLFRPEVRFLSMGQVKHDGYVCYLHQNYYAGADNIGKRVVVENMHGKHLRILKEITLEEIAFYEIDHDKMTVHYHKADKFTSSKEKIMTRPKEWFITQFNQVSAPHGHIVTLIDVMWSKLARTKPVATRHCNLIWSLYEKAPNDCDVLNDTCEFILKNKDYSDFKHIFIQTYNIMLELKQRTKELDLFSPEAQSAQGTTTANVSTESYLHGATYYEKFEH